MKYLPSKDFFKNSFKGLGIFLLSVVLLMLFFIALVGLYVTPKKFFISIEALTQMYNESRIPIEYMIYYFYEVMSYVAGFFIQLVYVLLAIGYVFSPKKEKPNTLDYERQNN